MWKENKQDLAHIFQETYFESYEIPQQQCIVLSIQIIKFA